MAWMKEFTFKKDEGGEEGEGRGKRKGGGERGEEGKSEEGEGITPVIIFHILNNMIYYFLG